MRWPRALAPDLEGMAPIPLPGEPASLVIGLDTGLENFPREDEDGSVVFFGPLPETLLVGTVSVAVRDASGLIHVIDATGQFQAAVAGQRIEVRLTDELPNGDRVTPDYPLELLGIQLLLQPPVDTRIAGDLEVTSLVGLDEAGTSTEVDLAPTRDGWTWLLERGLNPLEAAPTAPDDPEVVVFSEEGPIYGDEGSLELRLLPGSLAEVGDRPLPIAVSRGFADATGGEVGDRWRSARSRAARRSRSRQSSTPSRRSLPNGHSPCSTSAATHCPPTPAAGRTCSPTNGGCR